MGVGKQNVWSHTGRPNCGAPPSRTGARRWGAAVEKRAGRGLSHISSVEKLPCLAGRGDGQQLDGAHLYFRTPLGSSVAFCLPPFQATPRVGPREAGRAWLRTEPGTLDSWQSASLEAVLFEFLLDLEKHSVVHARKLRGKRLGSPPFLLFP